MTDNIKTIEVVIVGRYNIGSNLIKSFIGEHKDDEYMETKEDSILFYNYETIYN